VPYGGFLGRDRAKAFDVLGRHPHPLGKRAMAKMLLQKHAAGAGGR